MNKRRFFTLAAALAVSMAAPAFAQAQRTATAVFAGGCFWTVEHKFEDVPGVISAVSGYSGGTEKNPTYAAVSQHRTSHLEAVKVTYDPSKISYRKLVDNYWRMIDPTDNTGQACDKGGNYRTAIFVANDAERQAAMASKAAVDDGARRGKIVTAIRQAQTFWPAEAEHQDFAKLHAADYARYNRGCGRDVLLAKIWADKPKP